MQYNNKDSTCQKHLLFPDSRHERFWDIRGLKKWLRGFTNENERFRVKEKECRYKYFNFISTMV
jgi:hypothetical protein